MDKEIAGWLRQHLTPYFEKRSLPINDDTSFDALGLDSFTRVELISAIEEEFELELDPVLGFEFPTIKSLSEHIAGLEAPDGTTEQAG